MMNICMGMVAAPAKLGVTFGAQCCVRRAVEVDSVVLVTRLAKVASLHCTSPVLL